MSRVGKLAVQVPEDVQVELTKEEIKIKGKLGQLQAKLVNKVSVTFEKDLIEVKPANDSKAARSLWGTFRSIINNMVEGVSKGFEQRIEIKGVGFRASTNGKLLTLALGFSHDIIFAIPEGITVKCEKPTLIVISGPDKQQVGQFAGELIMLRPVEPYKGKGVFREGSYIRRKEGKKK